MTTPCTYVGSADPYCYEITGLYYEHVFTLDISDITLTNVTLSYLQLEAKLQRVRCQVNIDCRNQETKTLALIWGQTLFTRINAFVRSPMFIATLEGDFIKLRFQYVVSNGETSSFSSWTGRFRCPDGKTQSVLLTS